jgi:hypothetical protein
MQEINTLIAGQSNNAQQAQSAQGQFQAQQAQQGLGAWLPNQSQAASNQFFGVSRIDPTQLLMDDFLTHCKQVTEEKK